MASGGDHDRAKELTGKVIEAVGDQIRAVVGDDAEKIGEWVGVVYTEILKAITTADR